MAEQRSDDPSKGLKGLLGWVERTDGQYGDYFKAAAKAEAGDVVGPIKTDTGWYLLKVDDRQAAGRDTLLDDFLSEAGITDAEYRDYIRQEVLRGDFQQYFGDRVVTRYQPQREVAQIFLNPDQGQPVPKLRVRHLLVQPIPGAQDQSTATAAQWRAAQAGGRGAAPGGGRSRRTASGGSWPSRATTRAAPRGAGTWAGTTRPRWRSSSCPSSRRPPTTCASARSARWSAPSSATTSSRSPSDAPTRWSRPISS